MSKYGKYSKKEHKTKQKLIKQTSAWAPNMDETCSVAVFTRASVAMCFVLLTVSELCEDCAVANEIDYAWTSIHGIHDNGHVITACDVWL